MSPDTSRWAEISKVNIDWSDVQATYISIVNPTASSSDITWTSFREVPTKYYLSFWTSSWTISTARLISALSSWVGCTVLIPLLHFCELPLIHSKSWLAQAVDVFIPWGFSVGWPWECHIIHRPRKLYACPLSWQNLDLFLEILGHHLCVWLTWWRARSCLSLCNGVGIRPCIRGRGLRTFSAQRLTDYPIFIKWKKSQSCLRSSADLNVLKKSRAKASGKL